MVEKYKDTITGIVLILFSIIAYAATYSIKSLGLTNMSAKFFPAMCAIAVFFLSLILIYRDLKKNKNTMKAVKTKSKKFEVTKRIKNLMISLGVLFISILMLKPLGFIISMNFYLICSFVILTPKAKRNYFYLSIISLISTNAVYWIFVKGFKILLPKGFLG